MENNFSEIEELLVGYLSGDLSEVDRLIVDQWRAASSENEKVFQEWKYAWNAQPLLSEMEQFDSFAALRKINKRFELNNYSKLVNSVQRIAAIFLIPIAIYTAYITVRNSDLSAELSKEPATQIVSARQGMVSQFMLDDGTKVWLNSGSSLEFPLRFKGKTRPVKLIGEAFFDVVKNPNQPFVVHAHELNLEVLGTSFTVASYDSDSVSDVVLVTGKVKLSATYSSKNKELGLLMPGQRSVYNRRRQQAVFENVDVEKYITWRQGNLVFRDDPMSEVVKRLGRWFNVDIVMDAPELADYTYTATFRNEGLEKVLQLLKMSAPIDYRIQEPKNLKNGEFSRQKIFLIKKSKY
ncbi:MAG: hypothetical protein RIS47_915 [Bacteroidota bacterium]